MNRSTLVALLGAGTVLLVAACGDDDPDPAASSQLEGREFVGSDVEGHDLVEGTEIRLAFEADSMSAHAGCNRFAGGYTIEGGVLRAGALASTMMACEQSLMDQDAWLGEVLTGGPTLSVAGDTLTVTGSDGSVITLTDRQVAEPDLPLEETRWVVDGTVANEAVSSVPAGATASLTITDGAATVETGCNRGNGSVEVGETTLTFGPLATTKMACPPDLTELERAVLAVLDGDVTYTIESDRLSLRRSSDDGEIGLELRADT